MSSHPSKSDSRSCWKQIFHICFFAWCSVRRIYVMSSDAKDAKACYTKAGVKATPIKHGIFDWCSPSPLPKTFLITQKNPSGTSSGQVLLFICTLPSTAWLLFNKQLFKSNFSAFSLKFCLDVFSFCFLSSFFDYLRSSVN